MSHRRHGDRICDRPNQPHAQPVTFFALIPQHDLCFRLVEIEATTKEHCRRILRERTGLRHADVGVVFYRAPTVLEQQVLRDYVMTIPAVYQHHPQSIEPIIDLEKFFE